MVTRQERQTEIRQATFDDAMSIASVLRESFIEYHATYTPAAFAATALTSVEVLKRLSEGPVWVAIANESIVGTVSVVERAENLCVRGMAVLPAARGVRVGHILMTQVEMFARLRGYRRLVLSTTPFLTKAIQLYERFGFQRTNDGPHDLFGTPLFTMVKSL